MNVPDVAAQPMPTLLRLETLIRLRWLAIMGQLITIVFVLGVLDFTLPVWPALTLIGVSGVLNMALIARFPVTLRLTAPFAFALLTYDILQLSGLLFLTGGLQNPFAILLLAPVSVSATALPRRWTALVCLIVIASATGLTLYHLPLPWLEPEVLAFHPLYIWGMWFALVGSAAFIAAYTGRVAFEGRRLAEALTATELVLAREQHLTKLDGLATAAAHELGTPLATIALAAREMQNEPSYPAELKADLALISEQTARCRAILQKLHSLDTSFDALFAKISLSDLMAEIAAPHHNFNVEIEMAPGDRTGPEPTIQRNAGLLYGLGNLVENAIDFAASKVTIRWQWDTETVGITIIDDGPGIPDDLLGRLGEPYLTTRPRAATSLEATDPTGLGLGVFIAKTLLGRSQATLKFSNAEGGGARVSIIWPRMAIDADSPPPL
ncbi:MAG: ActS/PrrB/RegB family redox-sensitive histidine kinase [Alphaproteobacteria bacterium]|nr:ActS/PrrB/RegB family redox-sensitive histidine kinase [Alphaproteobacteria bacterium]